MTSEWSLVPIIAKCERKRKSIHHKVCYPFDHFRVGATYVTRGCSNSWFQTNLMYLLYFSLEMWTSVSLVSYLINTVTFHTPVMKMRTVQTTKAHSSARVIQDILEMESRVLVRWGSVPLPRGIIKGILGYHLLKPPSVKAFITTLLYFTSYNIIFWH